MTKEMNASVPKTATNSQKTSCLASLSCSAVFISTAESLPDCFAARASGSCVG